MHLYIATFGKPGLTGYNKDRLNRMPLNLGIEKIWYFPFAVDTHPWRIVNQLDQPDSFIVCEVPEDETFNGYTYDRITKGTYNSVVFIAYKTISRRFLFLKNIFSQWVLEHEFGHVLGLEHCNNIFCIMRPKFNLSFGRWCARCTRDLSKIPRQ